MVHDVWVEVDLRALKHNLRQVRSVISEKTRVLAVVKGNGFSCGYVEPSRAFIEAGADGLAVTRLEEALVLREAGIKAPILVFAQIQPRNAETAINADLDLTVSSVASTHAISEAGEKLGRIANVFIKVDTGMGRSGVLPHDAPSLFATIRGMPRIRIAGIYTHFSRAMETDLESSRHQLRVFQQLLQTLKADGIDYGMASSANSSAILRMPDSHLDIVRPGTLLYGQYPSAAVPHTLDLKPCWTLKARICEIRGIPSGSSIGYGGEYMTKRPTRTAVVPIGYADGFTLAPEGPIYRQSVLKYLAKKQRRRLTMEVQGRKVSVIGRVAMQMTILDITGIDGIEVGDEVIVPALRIPTSALIPRVYTDSND